MQLENIIEFASHNSSIMAEKDDDLTTEADWSVLVLDTRDRRRKDYHKVLESAVTFE